jgi:hypothetical protein
MNKQSFTFTVMATIGSLVAIAAPTFAAPAPASHDTSAPRVMLEEMRTLASTTADQADRVRMYGANYALSSDAQLSPLWTMKTDINTMGKEIATLEAERGTLQPWEQQAIDKVLPLLKEAANNTEEAIQFFNNNHNFLWSPEYRGYAQKVKEDSAQISKTLKTYLKYEKVQNQEEQLQNTIMPGAN